MLRLYIMLIPFGKQIRLFLTRQSGIAYQMHLILIPVQFGNINTLFIRAPGYIRQVLFLRQSGFSTRQFFPVAKL